MAVSVPNTDTHHGFLCMLLLHLLLVVFGFPCGSVVKNLPAMQEMQVRSLGREDPLDKGKATHSSILAWEIPWTEDPSGLKSMGLQQSSTRLSV